MFRWRVGAGSAAATTVAYAVFGFVWIAVSDPLVEALVDDTRTLVVIAIWKGWFFVALSSALIYVTVRGFTARLDASEARYRLMFAENPMPMMAYDPGDLRIIEINRSACGMLGYSAGEQVGHRVDDLCPPEDRAALERTLPTIRAGIAARTIWRVRRKDGRLLDVEIEGHSVSQGDRTVRVAVLIDITQRIEAETQLLIGLDQLALANGRLREIDQAISHDLQKPLLQINAFVQLLERRYKGRLDAEADEYIAFAVEGVGRLKALMSDAQRFAAAPVLRLEPVDLRAVLEEVLDRLRPEIEKAGAVIVIGRLPTLRADPDKLALLLFALVDNALKFRRAEVPCRITVEAERRPSAWLIRVRDNGVGIEPEYHEAIFTLFRRLHVRERISGNGTGLALVRKLAEAHGGEAWVESAVGEGAVFQFTIPDAPGA